MEAIHEQAFLPVQPGMLDINIIRIRAVRKELSALRLNQASGPDLLGAVVLRTMSQVLALPIAILCRRIFREAKWPQAWRIH